MKGLIWGLEVSEKKLLKFLFTRFLRWQDPDSDPSYYNLGAISELFKF